MSERNGFRCFINPKPASSSQATRTSISAASYSTTLQISSLPCRLPLTQNHLPALVQTRRKGQSMPSLEVLAARSIPIVWRIGASTTSRKRSTISISKCALLRRLIRTFLPIVPLYVRPSGTTECYIGVRSLSRTEYWTSFRSLRAVDGCDVSDNWFHCRECSCRISQSWLCYYRLAQRYCLTQLPVQLPPLIWMTEPVAYELSGDARNT